MNCPDCGGPLEVRKNASHQYLECGLDNVKLAGIEVRHCPNCGNMAPVLPDLPGLHRVIARAVASKPEPLNAQETVFLAKYISHSPVDPARNIGAAVLEAVEAGVESAEAIAIRDPALRLATFLAIGGTTNARMDQLAGQIKSAIRPRRRKGIKVRRPHKEWQEAA